MKRGMKASGIVNWIDQNLIWMVSIICLLVYMFTYFENCFGPPIRADGMGYYAYLPSLFKYGDFSFEELAEVQYNGEMPGATGVIRSPETGKYINKYGFGVAFLMMPFYLLATALTWVMRSPPGAWSWWKFNYEMNGYSFFYQHMMGLSGLVYSVAGLAVLKRFLNSLQLHKEDVLWAILFLLFGTQLLHYSSGETVLSHPYSFFLISLFLFLIPKWYQSADSIGLSILLGCVWGLIALVRLPNAGVIIIFLLYGINHFRDINGRLVFYQGHIRNLMLVGVAAGLCILPQFVWYYYVSGGLLVNSYSLQGESFHWGSPAVLSVLFSLKKGVFFWAPVLLLCIPGFFVMKSNCRQFKVAIISYLLLHVYIVSSWWMWWYGGSLGHRGFVDVYPLAVIPLAALITAIQFRYKRWLLIILLLSFSCYSLFWMKLYYTREISYYGLDFQAFYDIFYTRWKSICNNFNVY